MLKCGKVGGCLLSLVDTETGKWCVCVVVVVVVSERERERKKKKRKPGSVVNLF